MPTMAAPAAEAAKATETPHVARIISSDSIPAGGFTPGTILADRYRIFGFCLDDAGVDSQPASRFTDKFFGFMFRGGFALGFL